MKYYLLLFLNFFLILPVNAAVKCPLAVDRAYKATGQPAVYFVTKQCTKRAFTDSKAFFTHFKSWKDVRNTSTKLLNRITKDKNYLITFQKPTTAKPTKTKGDEKNVPQLSINDIFTSCPTNQEIQQIEQDFSINFMDPSPRTVSWSNYPYSCDTQTTNPTRLKVYNTIRYLQKIKFSEPLPFTSGKSLYDFLTLKTATTTTKLTIENRLECGIYSMGYNNHLTLGGLFSRWYPVLSGSNSCERVITPTNDPTLLNDFIYHPLFSSELFIHEAQHAITGKMHTANGNDLTIDEMGGWAAQFYFNAWVALYSTNTDDQTKNLAHNNAAFILQTRFTNPCPSDVTLRSVINQITPNTCR